MVIFDVGLHLVSFTFVGSLLLTMRHAHSTPILFIQSTRISVTVITVTVTISQGVVLTLAPMLGGYVVQVSVLHQLHFFTTTFNVRTGIIAPKMHHATCSPKSRHTQDRLHYVANHEFYAQALSLALHLHLRMPMHLYVATFSCLQNHLPPLYWLPIAISVPLGTAVHRSATVD